MGVDKATFYAFRRSKDQAHGWLNFNKFGISTSLHFHWLKEYYPNRRPTNLSRPGDYSAGIKFERVTGVMIVHPRSLYFARDLAHVYSALLRRQPLYLRKFSLGKSG